jgi:PAS domain S-box-containing protein
VTPETPHPPDSGLPPAASTLLPDPRLDSITEHTEAGYFFIGNDDCFQRVNDAWLRMHGFDSADEVLGHHYSLTQVDADLGRAVEVVAQLRGGLAIRAATFTRRRKDGSVGYHTYSANPVFDGGTVVGVEGFLIDVSELRDVEQRYRMLFEQMLDGFALHQMLFDSSGRPSDYRFLAVNPAFEQMTGLRAAQTVGRTVREVLPGVEQKWIDTYAQVVLTGEPRRFEDYVAALDKTYEVVAFRPVAGQFACITRDVTSARRDAQSTRESQDLFWNTFYRSSLAGTLTTLDDGTCLAVNDRFVEVFGLRRDQVKGKSTVDLGLWSAETRARVGSVLQAEGRVAGIEIEVRSADGSPRHLLYSAETVTIDGQARLLSFAQDITKRKKAEEALRTSEGRHRAVLEATRDWIWEVDVAGRFTYVSPQVTHMLGYLPDELLGHTPFEFLVPEDAQRLVALFTADVHAPRSETGLPNTCRAKDGSLVHLELYAVPVFGASGELVGFRGIDRDVTERTHAEEERSRLEDQLRQAQKIESIGRLAGGVAHDFNNLLAPILGYSEMLLAELTPGDPRFDELTQIRQAGERARDLTRQLLAFSRRQVLELKPVDLRAVLRGFEKLLRRTVREDIRIDLRLPDTLGSVRADVGQIEQVLMNLAVNAQDAMTDGGVITVSLSDVRLDEAFVARHPGSSAGAFVELVVGDTGCGMDTATLERLFEPFFTTKAPGVGTGLGLSTAYGIVKQHGGYILVASKPGRGTTFTIYLPCTDAPSAAPRAESPADAALPRGTETILIVEDADAVRELTRRALARQGYHLIVVEHPRRCIELVRDHQAPIHLLLTDVVMPDMNGRALYDQLARLRPGLKVIYMSGYTADVIANRGVLEAGLNFLQKPFSIEALAQKVREVLDGRTGM